MNSIQKNNIRVFGSGKQPLLLAHGYGCDQNMWRYMIPAFEEDYKLVLFDHIGFGGSDTTSYCSDRYASLQAYADDILQICDSLELADIIFVGHSVSSMLGILAAIKRPELFHKLILIGPSPCYIDKGDYRGGLSLQDVEGLLEVLDSNYLDWVNTLVPLVVRNPEKPELAKELKESFCRSNQQVARDFARLTFLSDNREDLPNLTIESLILQCSEDLIAPLEVGKYMHAHLPNSSLTILKATGHCPNLSAPEETISAIKSFLSPS